MVGQKLSLIITTLTLPTDIIFGTYSGASEAQKEPYFRSYPYPL